MERLSSASPGEVRFCGDSLYHLFSSISINFKAIAVASSSQAKLRRRDDALMAHLRFPRTAAD